MNLQNMVGDNAQGSDETGQIGMQGRVGSALSSLNTQQVSEAVAGSAGEMDTHQRANLVGSLLGGLGSAGVNLQSLLGRLGINHAVADDPAHASPEDAATIAAHAHENHPGVLQNAMSFYEEHPMLVKTLGAVAVAAIANHVQNSGRK